MEVTNEKPFSVPAHSFAISASASGFTLAYSADGNTYTNWSEATPAGEVCIVNGIAKGMIFKLVGNNGTVNIQY